MGKRQLICSCNCVDKTTSPIMTKFSVLLNHQKKKAFDNIFGDIFSYEYVFNLLKFQTFALKPEVCEMVPVAKWTKLTL